MLSSFALGVRAIRDNEVVDFTGEETMLVMMTRRPLPAQDFYRPEGFGACHALLCI